MSHDLPAGFIRLLIETHRVEQIVIFRAELVGPITAWARDSTGFCGAAFEYKGTEFHALGVTPEELARLVAANLSALNIQPPEVLRSSPIQPSEPPK